jgi:hypothetical protein
MSGEEARPVGRERQGNQAKNSNHNWTGEELQALRDQGLSYDEIVQRTGLTYTQINSKLYRHRKRTGRQEPQEAASQGPLPDRLLALLLKHKRDGIGLDELTDTLDVSKRVLVAVAQDLTDQGYTIVESGGVMLLSTTVEPVTHEHRDDWDGRRVIRFGVASDPHLASKYQQLAHLNHFYDICEREGISIVYVPGDLTEGIYTRRQGHIHERFLHSVDEQEQYIIDHWPRRKGVRTRFVLGNHDTTHIQNSGHDIGKPIHAAREDMDYLGQLNARVYLTPNCILELNHPLDGAAYALSYSLQKYIESIQGGTKPNILLNGHHHKAMYLFYRNIHAFEAGTFQAQSSWMKGKRLAAHMGGWIVQVTVDRDGTIERCDNTFIPYYKVIEHDW